MLLFRYLYQIAYSVMKFEYILHRLWLIVNVYYIMYIYDESHFIGPF